MGYRLGYARVSTAAQDPQLQLDALTAAGVDEVYVDHASGVATSRPKLDELLRHARPGDTIVIWRLDRLGRSMKHLLELIEQLEQRDVALVSLNEQIDTTSANGRLILRLLASLAAFERDLLAERTKAGLEAARKQGRVGGRPKALSPAAAEAATDMYRERKTVTQIADTLRVSRATIYRLIETLCLPDDSSSEQLESVEDWLAPAAGSQTASSGEALNVSIKLPQERKQSRSIAAVSREPDPSAASPFAAVADSHPRSAADLKA